MSTESMPVQGWTRNWPIARSRLREEIWTALGAWVPFTVLVFTIVAIVNLFGANITMSGWEMGSQISRWFVGAIGVYYTAVYLPLFVTHGWTRREAAVQMLVPGAVFALMLGVLMTAGYAIEGGVYELAGWSRELDNPHLFTSFDQYHLIFAEFGLSFLVWFAGGALVGAGFYRNGVVGAALIPIILLLAMLTDVAVGAGFGGEGVGALLSLVNIEVQRDSLPLAIVVTAGCVGVAGLLSWFIIRDVPIKSRNE